MPVVSPAVQMPPKAPAAPAPCTSASYEITSGSIASTKYVEVLTAIFGGQLSFPIDFVGRGDMSRGRLLLRQAEAGVELAYAKVAGATLHGQRPPKLPLVRRGPG